MGALSLDAQPIDMASKGSQGLHLGILERPQLKPSVGHQRSTLQGDYAGDDSPSGQPTE